MPRGVRASIKQKSTGLNNLRKAHVSRIGRRGMIYKKRLGIFKPRSV